MKKHSTNWNQKLIKSRKCYQILTGALLLLTSNLIFISCSLSPQRMDHVQKGEWTSRVLIKDKKNAKSYLVDIDFVSEKPNKLRMDVNTPIGSEVASVAVNGSQTTYVVIRKKIYYQGITSAKSFLPVLNLPLDPKLLMNVLYDQPVNMAGWSCHNDKNNFIAECDHSSDGMRITWTHRSAKQKIVNISRYDFEIEIQFNSFSIPQTVKEGIFTIAQPEGFKKIM